MLPWCFPFEVRLEDAMRWYHYVAYFFGGAFLANAVPHFVTGITGHPEPVRASAG